MLWRHSEGHVAQKRAAGRYDLNRASGRARGHGGGDFRFGCHGKRRRRAIKCDAGRAC